MDDILPADYFAGRNLPAILRDCTAHSDLYYLLGLLYIFDKGGEEAHILNEPRCKYFFSS